MYAMKQSALFWVLSGCAALRMPLRISQQQRDQLDNQSFRDLPMCIVQTMRAQDVATFPHMLSSVDCYSKLHAYKLFRETKQYDWKQDPDSKCPQDPLSAKNDCHTRTGHWNKVINIKNVLPSCQWLLHLDSDVAITDFHVRMETYTNHAEKLGAHVIASDMGPRVNNGAFMIRNSVEGFRFLDTWNAAENNYAYDNGPFNVALLTFGMKRTCNERSWKETDACITAALGGFSTYGRRVYGPVWQIGCNDSSALPNLQSDGKKEFTLRHHAAECEWQPGHFAIHTKSDKAVLSSRIPESC